MPPFDDGQIGVLLSAQGCVVPGTATILQPAAFVAFMQRVGVTPKDVIEENDA